MFPGAPEAVTPQWLSEALDKHVTDVTWQPIGTGQVGDSVRFTMQHGDGTASTLAGKFAAADPTSRATASMMGLYAKEVSFYRQIAADLAVRTPACAFAAINDDGSEFIILFEDLGPARIGNQLEGCTIAEARAAICQAAAIHGPSWNKPAMLGADWLQTPPGVSEQINTLYPQAHGVFRERYADSLEPEFMAVCEAVAALPSLSDIRLPAGGGAPLCIVHGDLRLDNMLFDIGGGAEPVAVLDWQTVTAGHAMTDIGYLMGTGFGDALRRVHEDELLDLYCAEMARRGVPLTRQDIARDYAIGALHGLTTAVFSAAFVKRTDRGDANFLSMARGACALALQHNSLGALKEQG